MGIEEQFYEEFGLKPDNKTMAVFIKAINETANPKNYLLRKAKVLSNLISTSDYIKENVQRAWNEVFDKTQEMFEEYIENKS